MECIYINPDTSDLANLLNQPDNQDIVNILTNKNTEKRYTLMAPSNNAMKLMSEVTKLAKVTTKDILKYHIMPGLITNAMVNSLHFIPSIYSLQGRAQGMKLARSYEGKMSLSSGPLPPATVISNEITATNGIVHVLDNIVTPPFSVQETLQRANLTHFLALVTHNDLITTMDKIVGGSVFAPTNTALESYLNHSPDLLDDDEAIYQLVKWHYAPSQVKFSSKVSIASPASLHTLSGLVQMERIGQVLEVNSVPVHLADLITRYGVLYIMDGVVDSI